MTRIKIGTRGSALALAQAQEARQGLMAAHGLAEEQFEIIVLSQIEEALLADAIDLAVHSMKDVRAIVRPGLAFAAVLPREDARDAFVSVAYTSLADLPEGASLATSSARRKAQALRLRHDLKLHHFHSNIGARLKHLADGVADASFFAVAGLRRLGLSHHITTMVEMDQMLPAVAQGAIGIHIKHGNKKVRALVEAIHDKPSGIALQCERAFLATLEGACRFPIAGHATVEGTKVSFRGQALTLDGAESFEHSLTGVAKDAVAMGIEAAEKVKSLGGKRLQNS
jgi:hydroxymethylbilane synthase